MSKLKQSEVMRKLEEARGDYEYSHSHLYTSTGAPFYAADVMTQKELAARETLRGNLSGLSATIANERQELDERIARRRADAYGWLTLEELQRAALLKSFVDADIATGRLDVVAAATMHRTGERPLERPVAWLLWRQADSVTQEQLERAAWPADLHADADTADSWTGLAYDVETADPAYMEGALHRMGLTDAMPV